MFTGLRPGEKLYEELHSDSSGLASPVTSEFWRGSSTRATRRACSRRCGSSKCSGTRATRPRSSASCGAWFPRYAEPRHDVGRAVPATPVVELPAACPPSAIWRRLTWTDRLREGAESAVAMGPLALSTPIWFAMWLEAGILRSGGLLVHEIRLGRTRRHYQRRYVGTKIAIDRRASSGAGRICSAAPIRCARFRTTGGPAQRAGSGRRRARHASLPAQRGTLRDGAGGTQARDGGVGAALESNPPGLRPALQRPARRHGPRADLRAPGRASRRTSRVADSTTSTTRKTDPCCSTIRTLARTWTVLWFPKRPELNVSGSGRQRCGERLGGGQRSDSMIQRTRKRACSRSSVVVAIGVPLRRSRRRLRRQRNRRLRIRHRAGRRAADLRVAPSRARAHGDREHRGTVVFPPVGEIKATGSTAKEFGNRISDRLSTISAPDHHGHRRRSRSS